MKRKIRHTDELTNFEYEYIYGVQDSRDVEIFGGKKSTENSNSTCIKNISWSKEDYNFLNRTYLLLENHVLKSTGQTCGEWNNGFSSWEEFAESMLSWTAYKFLEQPSFFKKYLKVNDILLSSNIETDFDSISCKISSLYMDLNEDDSEAFGLLLMSKANLGRIIGIAIRKYGYLEVTYDEWDFIKLFNR